MAQVETTISTPKGGVFNQVANWFTSLFRTSKLYLVALGNREVTPDINAEQAISLGFNANAAVYAIINDDADKFASIPRYVVDAKSILAKKRKLPLRYKDYARGKQLTNKLSALLERPNPYQGQAAFFKQVRAYYKCCGEGMIWLNRGDTEGLTDREIDLLPVLEMYPLPPQLVTVVPDEVDGSNVSALWGAMGYILKVSGQNMPLRKNDVIHWKSINLQWDASARTHLRGMTPLKPGAATLQQNNDATLSATRMYQNDGAKGVLYAEEKNGWTPTQESQIRGVVDKKVNNNDIKGAVATIAGAGKLGYLDLGGTSVDLQLLEGKENSWKELCALLGVPYELYNSATTFANKEQAQKGWVTNKIIPASKELDDELNRQLLNAFGLYGIALIQCDYSELPELQEDLAALATWLKDAWWITPNEKRELQGFEMVSDKLFDEPWIPSGITPLSQSQGDGFDQLAGQLGLSDYGVSKPQPAMQ